MHGQSEVEAAELASGALFGRGDLADLPEATLAAALREAGAVDLREADAPTLTDALVATQLVDSRSAARRAVAEGGAYVNNERVDDPDLDLAGADAAARLVGRPPRRGKRVRFRRPADLIVHDSASFHGAASVAGFDLRRTDRLMFRSLPVDGVKIARALGRVAPQPTWLFRMR